MTPAELYLAYQKDVRALARRLARSPAEAEDLVSATFEVLPKALESYRGEAQPRTFVLGVCTNLSRHLQRTAARRARAMESLAGQPAAAPPADPESLVLRRELAELVLRTLETLPEEQRTAFLLAGVEERPASEVAALVGVPEATVRSRLFHARRKLQAALSRHKVAVRAALALTLTVLVAGSGFAAYAHRETLSRWVGNAVKALVPRERQAPSPRAQALPLPPLEEAPFTGPIAPADVALPSTLTAAPPVVPRRRPAPAPAPENPTALYARAHAAHFVDRDDVRALAAWDAYLAAAPDGQLAPEARYNRGIALMRLGELAQAREAFIPFAQGALGDYRQEEAQALVEEIDRRLR